jgi:hypothetical protein
MTCIYCVRVGTRRPGICDAHAAILDVVQKYGSKWYHPIPLEVFFSQLRVRKVRVGIERVRALLEMMEMPYQSWPVLRGSRRNEND